MNKEQEMGKNKKICVYCGSSMGNDPIFEQTAQKVGRMIGETGNTLIYGGACCGTMGSVADAALEAGAHVHGIIPDFFKDFSFEVIHPALPQLTKVESMMERKEIMLRESDIFVTLPGSYGTLDELFETLVLQQLKQIDKPIFLLNVSGFYDPLLAQLDKMEDAGFLRPENRKLLRIVNTVEQLQEEIEKI